MRLLDPGWGEALRHQVGDPFLERDRVDTVEPLLAEPRKDSDPEQRLVASVGLRLEVRAGGQPALCPILEWRADKSGSIHSARYFCASTWIRYFAASTLRQNVLDRSRRVGSM